ncbi:MAG: Rossmann-like and DUF2520 domain-containing protein [Planctomycetota bacterium]|jgi:predicted short-subunit dehydrogenase-like oxidoreductase (DUF2520 family)
MRIAFVGCGAAGRPLGVAWRRNGHAIGAVHARTSAAEAVRVLGAGVPNGPVDDADVVVFATPDDALAEVARRHILAPAQVALHLSGAHPSTILAPTGARTASLHPLCPFADLEPSLAALPDSYFFVEGDAVETAERLARDLGPHVSRIATQDKVLYHAGAAIASNYVVTLLGLARELLTQAGVDEEHALGALVRLARGAVDNVSHVGVARGLTGPAARGDVELIARHVEALPDPTRALYLKLLEATLPIARAKGGLSDKAEAALRSYCARHDSSAG